MNEITTRPVSQAMQISQQMQSASVAREIAQVQSQMIVAMSNPRNITMVFEGIDKDCSRIGLASKATYAYAKGGTDVKGPSIRLLEAVARSYRNIKYGFEIVAQEKDTNTVRAYAFDMETNCQAERIFTVPNILHTKSEDKPLTDPRDIYENVANNASRRVRACLIEIIPGDIIDYALELCQKTIQANVKITPETIEALLNAFSDGFKISRVQIEDFIQRKIEAITVSQFLKLREIYASITDGISDAEQWFKPEDQCKVPGAKAAPVSKVSTEERSAAIKELEALGIKAEDLVEAVKGAKTIEDVSDQFLLDTLKAEKGGNA